ncbi:FAD-dependent oxidoreductase [Methylosinus sporium]|uniref:FAD-dependent oxidoreductase n=1 Tax=Methylosinus sporium TaxID=428 RepID=A0A549T0Q0_METSR|nr:FAD-dependent oxidoreductase [Methylosinus sporium]
MPPVTTRAIDAGTIIRRNLRDAPPRVLTTDLCVVGSGIAGVSAALEAARLGHRVVLVEAGGSLGGQSVAAQINTFCGFYANGPTPRQIVFGIADEILADLGKTGDVMLLRSRHNSFVVHYHSVALQRWIERATSRESVTPLLGAALFDARVEDERLVSISVATRAGILRIEAEAFVDATGDAAVAWMSGLATREPAAGPIYGSQNGILRNVDEQALAAIDRATLRSRLVAKGCAYGLDRSDAFIFTAPGSGETLVNMTHVETPLDPIHASEMVAVGHDKMDLALDFLRAEFPEAFSRAVVSIYGALGARQTRWFKSRCQLSADDVRAGTIFEDAIAHCAWPIELHNSLDQIYFEAFDEEHIHTIPFRCMVHDEVVNLLAVGRCVDGDALALSSIRVMGPCIAMGAAAAHAFDLAGGRFDAPPVGRLRRRLAANLGLAQLA